jgi:ketosteroid isomerase-like protein
MRAIQHGDAQDLLDAYKRAWEGRDVDAVMDLYAADAEHRDHPFRDAIVGHGAIRAMWNDIAANEVDIEFDAEGIWVSGATVLASWHAAYTDRTNADRVRMRGFLTMELDDARRITRLREWPVAQVIGRAAGAEARSDRAGEGQHGR